MNRPVHFEIFTENPERVAQFYKDILGWEAATWGPQQTYWLVTTGAEGTGGINGGISHRHFKQPVINTVAVGSLEEFLGKVERAGGKKVDGPTEIPGIGLHAYCEDPDGNMFGLLQPVPR